MVMIPTLNGRPIRPMHPGQSLRPMSPSVAAAASKVIDLLLTTHNPREELLQVARSVKQSIDSGSNTLDRDLFPLMRRLLFPNFGNVFPLSPSADPQAPEDIFPSAEMPHQRRAAATPVEPSEQEKPQGSDPR